MMGGGMMMRPMGYKAGKSVKVKCNWVETNLQKCIKGDLCPSKVYSNLGKDF